jgi:hypothetical protein
MRRHLVEEIMLAEHASSEDELDRKYDAKQLTAILRMHGYRVINTPPRYSSGTSTPPTPKQIIPKINAPSMLSGDDYFSPPRPGYDTPYVPMPSALEGVSIEGSSWSGGLSPSSPPGRIVPSLYTQTRPREQESSPITPASQREHVQQKEEPTSSSSMGTKKPSVKNLEMFDLLESRLREVELARSKPKPPAASPRPPARKHSSHIADNRNPHPSTATFTQASYRVSSPGERSSSPSLLRTVLDRGSTRSASAERSRGSASVSADIVNHLAEMRLGDKSPIRLSVVVSE